MVNQLQQENNKLHSICEETKQLLQDKESEMKRYKAECQFLREQTQSFNDINQRSLQNNDMRFEMLKAENQELLEKIANLEDNSYRMTENVMF